MRFQNLCFHIKSRKFFKKNKVQYKSSFRHSRNEHARTFDLKVTYTVLICVCLFHTLIHKYISSKVEPSFIQDIEMAPGFGGLNQYLG